MVRGVCVSCRKKSIGLLEKRGADWQAKGNKLKSEGKTEQAEKCYSKSNYWMLTANEAKIALHLSVYKMQRL